MSDKKAINLSPTMRKLVSQLQKKDKWLFKPKFQEGAWLKPDNHYVTYGTFEALLRRELIALQKDHEQSYELTPLGKTINLDQLD